jgi:hypothetical protein
LFLTASALAAMIVQQLGVIVQDVMLGYNNLYSK